MRSCKFLTSDNLDINISANTQRNKHVIITSKRSFDISFMRLLRFVFARVIVLCFGYDIQPPAGPYLMKCIDFCNRPLPNLDV